MTDIDCFDKFPKIPRLFRDIVITEKLDGMNAQVYVTRRKLSVHDAVSPRVAGVYTQISMEGSELFEYSVRAGSRNRWLTPDRDCHGFSKWVEENVFELVKLGVGRHFGEFWGGSIQRGYGQVEKRFSLFNTSKWHTLEDSPEYGGGIYKDSLTCYECPSCHVVPVLYEGAFDVDEIDHALEVLRKHGSRAAPGYMNPEGIIVYHTAASSMFKVTFDDNPKGEQTNPPF